MTAEIKDKAPLHSNEAEMMVLGCMLSNAQSLNTVASAELDDSFFYDTRHQIIFQELKKTYKNNRPADVHLICEDLKRQDKLNTVGGPAYVTALAQYAGTSAYVEEYVATLVTYKQQRDYAHLGQLILNDAKAGKDPAEIGMDIQENLQLIEKHGGIKDKFPIEFLKVDSILERPPAKPMLLTSLNNNGIACGYLPRGIVAMVVGAGGVGKTHLLAQLAVAVASGTPWLNQYQPIKKGNVFLGFGENDSKDICRLLYKASKNLRDHKPDILKEDPLQDLKRIAPYSFCGQQAAFIENGKPSSYFRRLKMKLISTAPKEGWDLLIFDPISRIMGADAETDNAAATQFIAVMEELALDLPGKPTVLLAHHKSKQALTSENDTKKQNQTSARGSSALTDGVRWQADLANIDGKTSFMVTKTNFTAYPDQIYLEKESDGYIIKSNKPSPPHTPIATKKGCTKQDQFSAMISEADDD